MFLKIQNLSFPARRSYPIPSLQGRNTPAAPHFNNR